MKKLPLFCFLGGLIAIQSVGHAALNRQNNILGKFVVTTINGTATCVSDGRILELKKGDSIVARGTTIETAPKSSVVLVFSNGTGVYTDASTRLQIERFEQEFFAPNNNLRVEPSNSSTLAKLISGRVVISTPRLLSGTTMIYQTPHAAVAIRGEKVLIEATEQRTHVAMISGNATVNPRDATGNFVAIGKRLTTGQEAFVKYTIDGSAPDSAASPSEPVAREPSPATGPAPAGPSADAPTAKPAVASAVVLKLSGAAYSRAGDSGDQALAAGSTVPAGSILSTGEGTELHLQPFSGAIATVLPNSVVELEQLAISPEGAKHAVTLALRAGAMVSTIDPAAQAKNEYLVRTLQGTARAHGTAFATSLSHGGFSIATTADTVTFTTTAGSSYRIVAGNVIATGPHREPQPPVPLAQAIGANPAFATLLRAAFSSTAGIVQDNLGGFSAGSLLHLFSRIAGNITTAMPDAAEELVAVAIAAINTPSSALSGRTAEGVATVVEAMTSAVPDRAAQIAAAAAHASPGQAAVIAAAAAKGSPAQAGQIAQAVAAAIVETDPDSGITAASLQNIAAVAAGAATSAPSQAGSIAAATLQGILQNSPRATAEGNARQAALIAATVTRATPSQAIPIARAMMRVLVNQLTEATPQILAQTAALLAGAIIAVVPPQAQPVATAVMQLLLDTHPNANESWILELAGRFGAMLAQLLPDVQIEIYAGIADALGRTLADVQALAARFDGFLDPGIAGIVEISGLAFQQGNAAAGALMAGLQLAQSAEPPAAPASSFGSFALFTTNGDPANATSIVVTQFDPAQVSELTSDLEAAQAAPTTVQFYAGPDGEGGTTVRPVPTVPHVLPVELTVSAATMPVR